MTPLLIIGAIAAIAAIIYLAVKAAQARAERERLRKAALAAWAASNGFAFAESDAWNLDARYNGLRDIGKGHDRYALEALMRQSPVPAFLFRYHYRTWETRTVSDGKGNSRTETYEETHWRRYLIVELSAAFPEFYLRPEGWFDKLKGFMGFDDINFESEDFSKRYYCKSADKQFAYAVIHPQMMEWMMTLAFEGELTRGLLVMDISQMDHTAVNCWKSWSTAIGFLNRIPAFVWHDYGKREPLTFEEPKPVAVLPPPAPVSAQ